MQQLPSEVINQVAKLSVSDLAQLILEHYPTMRKSVAYVIASRLNKAHKQVK